MGDQQISPLSRETKTGFLRHLLSDIHALERMIDEGQIESGVTRIGAEQEFCLIGNDMRPAMTGPGILKAIASGGESHFTSELAKWNLEINLDPQDAVSGCFQKMHRQLDQLVTLASEAADNAGSQLLLTGILPTIRKSDLSFRNMTPNPRYRVLDHSLKELRGENFSLFIEGVDEINLIHDSILFEACNTSFQIHLQVDPGEFADRYNWAQVLAGPVLAASVNSPTLLGKELWSETRIALFRQSVEIRHAGNYIRDKQPRVAFGYDWLKTSAAEIFKDDVAFYKLIIGAELGDETSLDLLNRGQVPQLKAMNVHNGTLYKWNRACYGVGGGKPHLRIENRYIPAGPTTIDEMANTVFWIGLMLAMPPKCCGAWDQHFYFQDVRSNFLKAARNGLSNEMFWFGRWIETDRLILDELLPLAQTGLSSIGVEPEESNPYLNVIEQRVKTKQTGAAWMIRAMRQLRENNSVDESMLTITKYMADHGTEDRPVHQWELPNSASLFMIPSRYNRVDSIMVTNLVTVHEDDIVEFAETLMNWNEFHHLPVENQSGEVTGVITARDIADFRESGGDPATALVETCMTADIISVAPETSVETAERIMLANDCGSLPVIRDNRVIGIITANDLRRLHAKVADQK
ncbi:MAG: CBS domain-containing protein [Planctomycetota bacterium]